MSAHTEGVVPPREIWVVVNAEGFPQTTTREQAEAEARMRDRMAPLRDCPHRIVRYILAAPEGGEGEKT